MDDYYYEYKNLMNDLIVVSKNYKRLEKIDESIKEILNKKELLMKEYYEIRCKENGMVSLEKNKVFNKALIISCLSFALMLAIKYLICDVMMIKFLDIILSIISFVVAFRLYNVVVDKNNFDDNLNKNDEYKKLIQDKKRIEGQIRALEFENEMLKDEKESLEFEISNKKNLISYKMDDFEIKNLINKSLTNGSEDEDLSDDLDVLSDKGRSRVKKLR